MTASDAAIPMPTGDEMASTTVDTSTSVLLGKAVVSKTEASTPPSLPDGRIIATREATDEATDCTAIEHEWREASRTHTMTVRRIDAQREAT
eukprot:7391808-Prymnesium_polylepis.1